MSEMKSKLSEQHRGCFVALVVRYTALKDMKFDIPIDQFSKNVFEIMELSDDNLVTRFIELYTAMKS